MAPEQRELREWTAKDFQNLFKVDIYQLGIMTFKLVFKNYPFEPSDEISGEEDPKFIENFMQSERNLYHITSIS